MIGSVLDKYEVLQKLGEGATATVYRGRHLTIGRDVAIKVLHPHLSASSRYRERFNREARAVGRLSHQNIVSILDYSGQTAEECYIVTELVDGVTLLELIQMRGRLPSEIAALVGADLASALAFAHREGIIHRDIKPENVMIRRDGRIKLMDFGVARVLDESSITLDGSLLGSPAYMSPQQALDETLDGRSDLFSLGTVLFHAVTGHVPFAGSNASVILRNIIESNRPDVLELAPQASPAIAAVIDRLLQPRPDDRYPTATDASEALIASLGEVRLTPDHPTINLRSYLVDPETCEEHLAAVLRPTLLEVGKERLAGGDTLGALQLFNRLLAIDEDNAEVIALIQSLHQSPPAPPSRRARAIVPAVAAVLLGTVFGAGWWLWNHGEVPPVKAHLAAADLPAKKEEPASLAATKLPAPAEADPSLPVSDGAADPVALAPEAPATPGSSSTRPPRAVPGMVSPLQPSEGVRLPTAAAVAPRAAKPARLVLRFTEVAYGADVWVDGTRVGARKDDNPSSTWVGTVANPILLEPGKREIKVNNPDSDDWIRVIEVSEDEPVTLDLNLVRKMVTFVVNPLIPDDCRLTVGTQPYDPLTTYRSFKLRDPDPTMLAVFECPPPLNTFRVAVGATRPGFESLLPNTRDLPRKAP